jgi:hypothetical protein
MLGRRPGLLGEEMRDTSREVVRFGGKTLQSERKIPVETQELAQVYETDVWRRGPTKITWLDPPAERAGKVPRPSA